MSIRCEISILLSVLKKFMWFWSDGTSLCNSIIEAVENIAVRIWMKTLPSCDSTPPLAWLSLGVLLYEMPAPQFVYHQPTQSSGPSGTPFTWPLCGCWFFSRWVTATCEHRFASLISMARSTPWALAKRRVLMNWWQLALVFPGSFWILRESGLDIWKLMWLTKYFKWRLKKKKHLMLWTSEKLVCRVFPHSTPLQR